MRFGYGPEGSVGEGPEGTGWVNVRRGAAGGLDAPEGMEGGGPTVPVGMGGREGLQDRVEVGVESGKDVLASCKGCGVDDGEDKV